MRTLFALTLLALSFTARAQTPPATPSEEPALKGDVATPVAAPAAKPAAPASPKSSPKNPESGTTIVGERESPIGLFITPWRNSLAEQDLDRPARLLQENLMFIDEDVFVRQIEYYEALSGALAQKNAVTPPVPASAPAP